MERKELKTNYVLKAQVKRLFKYIAVWIFIFAALLMLMPIFRHMLRTEYIYELFTLEDGWIIERDEVTSSDVSRRKAVAKPVRSGNSVIFMHDLPSEEVPDAQLDLLIYRASLQVYVENEQIYTFQQADGNVSFPKMRLAIDLPEGYAGKRLTIVMTAEDDPGVYKFQPVCIGNREDLLAKWLYDRSYALFIGVFLLTYGVLTACVCLFLIKYFLHNLRFMIASVILISAGLQTLSYYGLFAMISGSVSLDSEIEHISRIVLFVFMGLFMVYSVFRIVSEKKEDTGEEETERTEQDSLNEWIPVFGYFALVICLLLDAVIFRPMRTQTITGLFSTGMSLTMLGYILFSSAIIQTHYAHTARYYVETRRNVKLTGIAYTDPLTGASNRVHCEQIMQALDKEKAKYCIINLDVNGLKKINDTLGHAAGDRFLKGFALILKAAYKNAELVGRMGGDEFIVILKNMNLSEGQDEAEKLEVLLHRLNRGGSAFHYEASYGCAFSGEVFGSRKVYQLADDRMYEMKRLVHARNGGNGRD